MLRNSESLGSGGTKEEQKHFPQAMGSGSPAAIAGTRTPPSGKGIPGGQPYRVPPGPVPRLAPRPLPKDGPGALALALQIPVIPAKFFNSGSLLAAET